MRHLVCCCLLLVLTGRAAPLVGQSTVDSTGNYLDLIEELAKSENFEQAQVESENLQAYLGRTHGMWPARAVGLFSQVYQHNRDEASAALFVTAVAQQLQREKNLERRADCLNALITACNNWHWPDKALTLQQQLYVVKDSIAEQRRQVSLNALRLQMDSLSAIRREEVAEQSKFVRLETDRALLVAGAILLSFMGLLLANWKTNARWRKRLAKKELELEFLRSDRFASTLPADPAFEQPAEQAATAYESPGYYTSGGKRPDKTALLIEPNRQIVLYLKSLLSDRFEVETAVTASEGLQIANNHLPDLIICDAVLNGKTGIDVIRQIKLSDRTNHIPIILFTDRYGNEGKLDALRAGADAWFSRPVLDNEFDAQVSRLLEARKEKHEAFSRFLHLYFSENRIALDDPFLTQTVQLIDQYLSDPDFMADDLARKMQLHKQHFFKKLHVLTGKEPIQLIREMRLEKAKALLEKRAGTPQAIAELVGFSSTGTFALAFKEYFGENTSLLQMPNKS